MDNWIPLSQLKATDLITVPSPSCDEERVLSCILLDPQRCNEYVPYVVLEGRHRGVAYNSPPTMLVRRANNINHKIPPIPLLLFNYGELSHSPKLSLEENGEPYAQRNGANPYSEGRQLPLSLLLDVVC